MSVRTIALKTSPRRNSNSSRLLEEALAGASEAGADAKVIDLAKSTIRPCNACDGCMRTGRCVVTSDDFLGIMDEVMGADRLLVASPIYYMGPPAQLKLFIDRTQCLFNLKYKIRKRLDPAEVESRKVAAIAVCGSRKKFAFDGFDVTMSYLCDSLQMTFFEKLYLKGIDAAGEIEKHPEALHKARDLGRRLAEG